MMDPAELTQSFDRNSAALLLYARQWLDSAAAEDVVQEAFVRLMVERSRPGNVKAWLFRATRNLAISHWRVSCRRQQREYAVAREEPCFEVSSEEAIDSKIAAEALKLIPRLQREVIVLRIWGQLKLAEIATVTRMPVSTVYHHYRQGLSEIRTQMGITCTNLKH